MSNGSVTGAGGVPQPPYTSGTPDDETKTGQKDGRTVTTTDADTLLGDPARTGQGSRKTKVPLSKRAVSSTTGEPVLKPLPKPTEQYQPFETSTPDTDSDEPPALTRKNSTGQYEPDNEDDIDQPAHLPPGRTTTPKSSTSTQPKLTVETDGLKPLPPLTPEQQENKQKFISVLSGALSFVKAHKNTFAMGIGGLMVGASLPLAFLAPPLFGVLFGVGFAVFFAGFGNAMFGTDTGGPGGPSQTSEEEKNKPDDKNKPGELDDPSKTGSNGQSPTAGPGGHFAKIQNPVQETATVGLDSDEFFAKRKAEQELIARQRHMANLQRHMVKDLNKLTEQASLSTQGAASAKLTRTQQKKLEAGFISVVAEYLTRADVKCTPEIAKQITESAVLLAQTSQETQGMTEPERQAAFQAAFSGLLANTSIPKDTLSMLKSSMQYFGTSNLQNLNAAARKLMGSVGAMIDAAKITQPETGQETSVVPPVVEDTDDFLTGGAGAPKKMTVEEVETALRTDRGKLDELSNGHFIPLLDDVLKQEEDRMRRVEELQASEIERFRKETLGKAISVLEAERMDSAVFKTKLLDKIDPAHRSTDYQRVERALNSQPWFKGK